MLTNPDNTDIGAYEILKKRGFTADDIAGLAEYLDEHRRRTMQPVLDQISAQFDQVRSEIAAVRSEMVSWKQAWVFVAILIGVAMILPEALEKIVKQIQLLSGTAVTQDVSS